MPLDSTSSNWRLCHPVTIYIYRNGNDSEAPTLVHIPGEKKKNMETALLAIQDRMTFPAAYAKTLYHTNGIRVCRTTELQMYGNYVVLTNLDKRFKCADYGKGVRDPLVVIGKQSKHIRTIQNKIENGIDNPFFQRLFALKRHNVSLQVKYAFASNYQSNGLGPTDLPYITGCQECGTLCHKMKPKPKEMCYERESRTKTRKPLCTAYEEYDYNNSCSDPESSKKEARGCSNCACKPPRSSCQTDKPMTGDSALEEFCESGRKNKKHSAQKEYCPPKECKENLQIERIVYVEKPSVEMFHRSVGTDTVMPSKDKDTNTKRRSSVDSEHLLEFINQYKDIGGQLVNMFNDRFVDVESASRPSSQRSLAKNKHEHLGDDLFHKFVERLDMECENYDDNRDDLGYQGDASKQSSNIRFNTASAWRLPDLPDLDALGDSNTGVGGTSAMKSDSMQPLDLESMGVNANPSPSTTEFLLNPQSDGQDVTGTSKPGARTKTTTTRNQNQNLTTTTSRTLDVDVNINDGSVRNPTVYHMTQDEFRLPFDIYDPTKRSHTHNYDTKKRPKSILDCVDDLSVSGCYRYDYNYNAGSTVQEERTHRDPRLRFPWEVDDTGADDNNNTNTNNDHNHSHIHRNPGFILPPLPVPVPPRTRQRQRQRQQDRGLEVVAYHDYQDEDHRDILQRRHQGQYNYRVPLRSGWGLNSFNPDLNDYNYDALDLDLDLLNHEGEGYERERNENENRTSISQQEQTPVFDRDGNVMYYILL